MALSKSYSCQQNLYQLNKIKIPVKNKIYKINKIQIFTWIWQCTQELNKKKKNKQTQPANNKLVSNNILFYFNTNAFFFLFEVSSNKDQFFFWNSSIWFACQFLKYILSTLLTERINLIKHYANLPKWQVFTAKGKLKKKNIVKSGYTRFQNLPDQFFSTWESLHGAKVI